MDDFQWEVDAELVAQIKPVTDAMKAAALAEQQQKEAA